MIPLHMAIPVLHGVILTLASRKDEQIRYFLNRLPKDKGIMEV